MQAIGDRWTIWGHKPLACDPVTVFQIAQVEYEYLSVRSYGLYFQRKADLHSKLEPLQ